MTCYRSSFITDHTGAMLVEANQLDETYPIARIDPDATCTIRQSWGTRPDRRPATCGLITRHDTAV